MKGNHKHGMTKTKLYRTFYHIKFRCNNKNDSRYGGRGIKCEWKDFESFKEDMHESYLKAVSEHGKERLSIDRIDNDGNYCKENCRWATAKEQSRNRRYNIKITFNGETKIISEWSETTGIKSGTLQQRYHLGWLPEQILTTPVLSWEEVRKLGTVAQHERRNN